MHLSGKPDGIVTEDEFIEYYTNVSASIDDDGYFSQMMNQAWNIQGDASSYSKYDKGWKGEEAKAAGVKPAQGQGKGSYQGPVRDA